MVDPLPAPDALPLGADAILRLLRPADATAMFELVDRNRPWLRQWLPWIDAAQSPVNSRSFIIAATEQVRLREGFHCGIIERGNLAGVIGLQRIDWANRKTAIGYWLGRNFTGRGLMTRAVEAVTTWCITELDLYRIEIRCAVGNAPSRRIPERLGFRLEGILRSSEWLYDHYVDHAVYSRLAEE